MKTSRQVRQDARCAKKSNSDLSSWRSWHLGDLGMLFFGATSDAWRSGERAQLVDGQNSAQKKADPGKVGFEWGW
jgi:hypothetical protein